MEAIKHIKTVIVKADSGKLFRSSILQNTTLSYNIYTIDITLGTLYDRYEDMIAEVEEQLQQQDRDPGNATLRINQVLHWGIGEVGMKDVNMAKAGDGKQQQCAIFYVAMTIYSFQCCILILVSY